MQTHEIQPIHKAHRGKRIGRGGKRGTYSGRGIKGQGARSGRKMQPRIRELIKRYPKLRGYKFGIVKAKPVTLNVGILEKNFEKGAHITPSALREKRLIKITGKRTPAVKILGTGKLTKTLSIESCVVSAGAKTKIEAVGGTIK